MTAQERAWHNADEPIDLYRSGRGFYSDSRFRWLAAEWVAKVQFLVREELPNIAQQMRDWNEGQGVHPKTLVENSYWPLDVVSSHVECARMAMYGILQSNWPMVAAFSADAIEGHTYQLPPPHSLMIADHEHAPRSSQKREKLETDMRNRSQQWQSELRLKADELRQQFLAEFRDVAGNPFQPVVIAPQWRNDTVLAIARGIDEASAWDRLPILADALEEAGCTQETLLRHCRDDGIHVRGCWAVSSLLEHPG